MTEPAPASARASKCDPVLAAVAALTFVAALVPHRIDAVWKGQNLAIPLLVFFYVLWWPRLRFATDDLVGAGFLFAILLAEGLVFVLLARPGFDPKILLKEIRDPLLGIGAGIWAAGVTRSVDPRRAVATMTLVVVGGALTYLALHFTRFAPIVTRFENLAEAKGAMAGFESPNSLGAAVAILLPFLAVGVATAPRWRWKGVGALILFGAAAVVLAATRSRGALLAGCSGLALTFVIGWRRVPVARPRVAGLVALLVVAGIGALLLLQNTVIGRLSNLQWSRLDRDRTTAERVEMLRAGAEIFAAHPLMGAGLGGYAAESPGVLPFLTAEADTPHNEILFVGAQGGIVGLVLLGALYVWLFRRAGRLLRSDDKAWGVAAVGFVVTWLLVALFFPYSFTPDVGILAWVIAGFLGAPVAARTGGAA